MRWSTQYVSISRSKISVYASSKKGIVSVAKIRVHVREDGPRVQLCGDSEFAEKWVNGQYVLGQKYRGRIGHILKTLRSWWKRRIAHPISKIDHPMRTVREHNLEADHLANLGAKGQRQIVVDKGNNDEKLKAVLGLWDGSSKINDRSGCGVVIKGVDRNKWITISNSRNP